MKAFIGLCVLLLVTGCGSSKPSAGDGKKELGEFWGLCGKAVKVVDFEKINGIEQSEKQYKMAYSYNLEFIDDVVVKDGVISNFTLQNETLANYCNPNIHVKTVLGNSFITLLVRFVPKGGIGEGKVPKGTKIPMEGEATFIKTDNGWQMQLQ